MAWIPIVWFKNGEHPILCVPGGKMALFWRKMLGERPKKKNVGLHAQFIKEYMWKKKKVGKSRLTGNHHSILLYHYYSTAP